jgi:outer membrane protein assembly factor BamA
LITFNVQRGKRYRIVSVDWPAGLRVNTTEILMPKALSTGAWFDQSGVVSGLLIVLAQYQQLGFHRAVMKPTYDEVEGRSPGEGGVIIHPTLTEGPRATITAITFDLGDRPVVTQADLAARMLSKVSGPYSLPSVELDRDALLAFYERLGFLNRSATITPELNEAGTEARLAVFAREGPQILVGEIIVVGNERLRRDEILREVTLRPGAPYSEEARIDSRSRLMNQLGLRNVRITADERLPGETTVRIVVSVEEASALTWDVGGGLEGGTHPRAVAGGGIEDRLEFAPRAFVGIGRRNLGGRNRSVNAFARVSFKPKNAPGDPARDGRGLGFTEYRVTGSYRERYAFRSATDLLISLTSEQAIRTSFNFIRRSATAEFLRPVTPRVSLLGRYSLEWTRLFDEVIPVAEQPLIDRLFPQVRLSIFSGGAVWDRRDDQINPRTGGQMNANLDVAVVPLGSEVGFAKFFAQGSIFRTIPATRQLTFAGRLQVGLARGFERTVLVVDQNGQPVLDPNGDQVVQVVADLPASHRLFAGGSNSVRGFQLDRLGVEEILNDNGLSNGGNALIVVNAELRAFVGRLFTRDLAVVGFVDAGNVFRRVTDMDLGRLRATVGFGVRYDSWLGPLRLDLGFKTDRMIFVNARERRWEFHLSLGEVF